jgi:predicted Zn-dependent protease
MMKRLLLHLVSSLMLIFLVSSCSIQESPITGSKRAYAYTWEQEVEIGRNADQEIVGQYGEYNDEQVNDYVNNLSREVLSVSHLRRDDVPERYRETEFTFRVLDSPVVNAFALPGGYVYVTRGLLAHLNNDAQLAVVQGHEIGHVAARHASQRGLQQTIGQFAVVGGAILGQELLGLSGERILNLSSTAAQLLFLSYSRDNERESDQLGVEYAAMTGYAAEEGAAFFTSLKRISEQSGSSLPNMLSSHPDPGEREQNIPRMAGEWEEKGYEQTIRNTEGYMQMLDGMIYGENPRNGYVHEGAFVHPDMRFRFDVANGWQVINQASRVVQVNESGSAVIIFSIDSDSESARQSVEKYSGQEGFTLQGSEEALTSGQLPAYKGNYTVQTQDGELGVQVTAVEYENAVYEFLSYTSSSSFESLETLFNGVGLSFAELTDPAILNIRPVRLQVERANRSGTFSDFLPSELPMSITPEEVAILNQVTLSDRIDAGTYLKIPIQ